MESPQRSRPEGVDTARVTEWLAANVDGARAPFEFRLIAGGHSNLTYKVTGADGRGMVLRRPPLGHVLATAHDVGREHRIISALRATSVPVPEALGHCADPSVNGAPFYVMDFVPGHALREPAEAEMLVPEHRRAALADQLVDVLAAIHAVDPDQVGLGDLGRREDYIARQLRRWYGQWNQTKTRELPAVDEVHTHLRARIPDQSGVSLVHGDYRLDNCLVDRSGSVRAVLDWELCTLGEPLADVGLFMAYWAGPDEPRPAIDGPTSLPGFPPAEALAERYARVSGRDLSSLPFFTAFSFWRVACILEGVYARYLAGSMGGQSVDADAFRARVEHCASRAAELAAKVP